MPIPRACPNENRRQAAPARLALLIAGTAGLALVAAASLAQETGGLRGYLTGDQLDNQAVDPNASTQSPLYRPSSQGAVPDDQTLDLSGSDGTVPNDYLLGGNAEDPFAGEGLPINAQEDTQSAVAQEARRAATARSRQSQLQSSAATTTNAARNATAATTDAADTIDAQAADAQAAAGQETDATTTGAVRQRTVDYDNTQDFERARTDNERATPVEAFDRNADDNPYEATGIRAGGFILRPSLEQGIEWTSNAAQSAGGSSAFVSETTGRLSGQSDWASNSASFNAYGTWRKSVSGASVDDLQLGADGALRIDLDHEFALNATAGYARKLESATSAVEIPNVSEQPVRQTLIGSAGVEKALGKARLALTGSLERNAYSNATLTDGSTLSQADRDNTLATLTLRGGYQVTPALTPFVELELGRRSYDQTLDSGGYARSANRFGLRGGAALDLGEKLSGEASLGWISEDFDDMRLATLSGVTASANLSWSPVRSTTVALTGSTSVEGGSGGASGSILYASQLSVTRQLRANLTGTALLEADWRNYAGSTDHELTLAGEASLTWWLNRNLGVTGRARHEKFDSTIAGRDYSATSLFLGVKLQR